MQVTVLDDQRLAAWEAWFRALPDAPLWQSPAWKAFQEALGRQTRVYALMDGKTLRGAALVVLDSTRGGLTTWDIPRGPIGEVGEILKTITSDARAAKALSLTWSPAQKALLPGADLSGRHVQPEATRVLDLTLNDDALLEQMKPKGRYNIRLAEKHGVIVQESADANAFARLMADTGKRDGFTPQSARHYQTFLQSLPGSFLLLAYAPKTPQDASPGDKAAGTGAAPIAGLMGAVWGTQGIYYYGASSHEARALMAPYALQWQAMLRCRTAGCRSYDLFGIAPEGAGSRHPWGGVSDFKAKFGGTVITYPPEQQLVFRPVAHAALKMKRKILG